MYFFIKSRESSPSTVLSAAAFMCTCITCLARVTSLFSSCSSFTMKIVSNLRW